MPFRKVYLPWAAVHLTILLVKPYSPLSKYEMLFDWYTGSVAGVDGTGGRGKARCPGSHAIDATSSPQHPGGEKARAALRVVRLEARGLPCRPRVVFPRGVLRCRAEPALRGSDVGVGVAHLRIKRCGNQPVNLYAIEQARLLGHLRVGGVETPLERADAATGTTSRLKFDFHTRSQISTRRSTSTGRPSTRTTARATSSFPGSATRPCRGRSSSRSTGIARRERRSRDCVVLLLLVP